MKSLDKLDEIIFRCFSQGQYWGTASEDTGKLNQDYKPENPIDRDQAKQEIKSLFMEIVGEDEGITISTLATDVKHTRNQLRSEQRKKIEDL
jgi:hypothetical protein